MVIEPRAGFGGTKIIENIIIAALCIGRKRTNGLFQRGQRVFNGGDNNEIFQRVEFFSKKTKEADNKKSTFVLIMF